MRRFIRHSLILTIFFCAASTGSLWAQSSFWDDTDLDEFSTGGSIGLQASAYTADGIENRRAPGVIEATSDLNFRLFGLQSGFNMNYSTDDSGFRQNMNRLSFNSSWRWLTVRAGDVAPRFSEYGLNGANIRGAYLRMSPGDFLLELTGGRSRRAIQPGVETGFRDPSFEQWAVAGKIGYGSTNRSYFHFSTFYAIDDRTSLEQQNLDISPRENLTLTPDFQVSLFDGRFTFGSEVTASVYTRDLNRSPIPLDETDIPGFIGSIYSPRVSSRVNYAGDLHASLSVDFFDLGLGYERVQPGFESLGMSRVRDDQERFRISPSMRFLQNRLTISTDVSHGRDNLLGTRLQTQSNTNASANVQMVFSERFSLNTNYNLVLNNMSSESGDEEAGTAGQSQISHNIMLQPTFTLMRNDYTHNISVTGGYLTMDNRFDDEMQANGADFGSTSITSALSYSVTLPTGLTINSSANYLINRSEQVDIDNLGLNAGASYSLMNRRLTLSANSGFSLNTNERDAAATGEQVRTRIRQLTTSINSSYRFTDRDSFSLRLRVRNNTVAEGSGREFTELEGSFQYQRSF